METLCVTDPDQPTGVINIGPSDCEYINELHCLAILSPSRERSERMG